MTYVHQFDSYHVHDWAEEFALVAESWHGDIFEMIEGARKRGSNAVKGGPWWNGSFRGDRWGQNFIESSWANKDLNCGHSRQSPGWSHSQVKTTGIERWRRAASLVGFNGEMDYEHENEGYFWTAMGNSLS